MTTSYTLASSITDEDGDFFSSMGDDDDDDGYGSSNSFGYDHVNGSGTRRRPNQNQNRDHYNHYNHPQRQQQQQQQQLDKTRRAQDVQMQICSLITDPYVSIPSLVQKVSRLVPALLGLNEREEDRSRLPSAVIVSESGDPAALCDEDGCQDCSYYRAKIVVEDDDDCSPSSPDSSNNADYRIAERSSFTSGDSSSPTSSLHHHHRRCLPKLPMISDNTVDRLRHVFASEEIPFPNEELNFDTEHGAMSSPGPTGGLFCHSAKTGVIGKIEIYKYAMLGRSPVPRTHNSLRRSDGNDNNLQQLLQPTPEQASRLERLAEQLGKAIVHRRKQQDTQRRLQKLTDTNRRLVESQKLARIGQWELDLTMAAGESDSLYWSDAIYDIFRIPKTKFGASYEAFLNAIHPDDRNYVDSSYKNSLKTKQPYDIVHRLLFKGETGEDDEVRWIREVCRTEYDGDTPFYSVGIVQDLNSDELVKDGISNISSRIDGTRTATTTTTTTATASVNTPIMPTKTSTSETQVCQDMATCLKNILTCVYTLPGNGYHQKLKAIRSCMEAMELVKSMENGIKQKSETTHVAVAERTNDANDDNPRWQQRPGDRRQQQQRTRMTSTRRSLREDFRMSLLNRGDDHDHDDYRDEESEQSSYLQEQQKNQRGSRSSFFLNRQALPLEATRSLEQNNVIFRKCA